MLKKLIAFVLIGFFTVASAFAYDGYLKITNQTQKAFFYIYISHQDSEDWEEDVLDDDVLMPGKTLKVDITGYPDSIFDIMVEDEDGNTYTYWDFDIDEYDLLVKPEHMDDE